MEKHMTTQRKNYTCLLAGILMLTGFWGLQLAAREVDGFPGWYAHTIYPMLVGTVGRLFGLVPFSMVELGLYLLILICIFYGIRFIRQPLRLLSRAVCLCGALLLVYTLNCGINYHAPAFSEYAGLETGEYTKEELEELCEFLVGQVNELAAKEQTAENAALQRYRDHRAEWRMEGVRAMEKVGGTFSCLAGFYPRPKEVTVSWILSVQQLCGVYSPFTIEANFNGEMPNYNIPHTICHELSHLRGFMREDEANFIGYLACIGSENPAFRYSGYLMGWVYAGNALARTDMEAYIRLSECLCDQAKVDLQENNRFWNQYEGRVAEVSSQINDSYLKANGQADGVQSYGRVVDLMLAYQAENPGEGQDEAKQ